VAQIIAPRPQALRLSAQALLPIAVVFLLCAAIGVELMVLAAWLPDTLNSWLHPDTAGYGDFPVFYRSGQEIHLNATYSPGLSLLMHPLTHFSMRAAFQIYFAINVAALCGVAWLAQRAVCWRCRRRTGRCGWDTSPRSLRWRRCAGCCSPSGGRSGPGCCWASWP
jgi:hypothetical protein